MANVAANLIADGSTPQDFLTYFGRCFIRAAGPFKYETLIKVTKKAISKIFLNLMLYSLYPAESNTKEIDSVTQTSNIFENARRKRMRAKLTILEGNIKCWITVDSRADCMPTSHYMAVETF
jgi:hypothetical protein